MPQFSYKARDVYGNLVSEEVEAPSALAVQDIIRSKNLILVSVDEKREFLQQLRAVTQKVRTKEIVVFARQLAVLVSATVPIVRALRILGKQTESRTLRDIIDNIANDVDGGARLSSAMHQYPHVFDDFFVYMIRAGETTGRLDEVLTYLADQKEKDYALVSRVISSMIYPAFIVLVLVGMFVFMMIYVVPRLLEVVTSTGAELPLPTKILLGTSAVFQHYWWLMLIVIILFFGVLAFMRRNQAGKHILDRIKLHLPIVGKIFRRVYIARFGRSLANLLASGVPVNRSIEIVADIIGNQVYKNILLNARKEIEAGRTLSHTLAQSDEIPPMVVQMIGIGEETGRLDQILGKISDFYTEEVASLTNALASVIEPLIIILLGAGALVLVTGILMPIYSVTAQF